MLESLFNKVANLRPASLLEKTPAQVFSCEIWESFRNTYFEEHLRTTAPEETPLLEVFEFEIGLL